jgi:hypothetical protein
VGHTGHQGGEQGDRAPTDLNIFVVTNGTSSLTGTSLTT